MNSVLDGLPGRESLAASYLRASSGQYLTYFFSLYITVQGSAVRLPTLPSPKIFTRRVLVHAPPSPSGFRLWTFCLRGWSLGEEDGEVIFLFNFGDTGALPCCLYYFFWP